MPAAILESVSFLRIFNSFGPISFGDEELNINRREVKYFVLTIKDKLFSISYIKQGLIQCQVIAVAVE